MAAADSDFSKTAPEQGDPRPEGTTSNDRTQAPDSPPGSGSVLENFLSLGSGIVISKAVAFIGTAYLARRLGVYGFGIIGFATAVCTYFAIALKAGFGPVGAREVARHPGQIAPVSAGVIVLRLTLAGGVLVLTYLGTLVLDKPEIVKWVVMLTALTYISLSLDTGWVYKGLGRNRRVGVSLIMAQAIYVAALLLLVRGPEDILWVPLSLVFGELFAAAYLAVPLFRGSSWAPDLPKAWSIFHASIPLVIGQLLRALINVFDVVLLALLLGEVSVGLYTAAYRICFLVILIGHSLQVAYLPALSRAAHRSNARASQLVDRALEFAAAIAVPMATGGILLAGPLLIHLFGPEYGEGTEAFRLLLISVAFIFVHGVFGNTLLAHDRTRVLMWIQALGASLECGPEPDPDSPPWHRRRGCGHRRGRRAHPESRLLCLPTPGTRDFLRVPDQTHRGGHRHGGTPPLARTRILLAPSTGCRNRDVQRHADPDRRHSSRCAAEPPTQPP